MQFKNEILELAKEHMVQVAAIADFEDRPTPWLNFDKTAQMMTEFGIELLAWASIRRDK